MFATETDAEGKAASLWMLQNPDLTSPDHYGEMLRSYPMLDSLHHRTCRNARIEVTFQVSELYCAKEGWGLRVEADKYPGLGLAGFDYADRMEPVHFVRVA